MNSQIHHLGDYVELLSGYAFKSDQFNEGGDGLPLVRIRNVVSGRSNTYYSGHYLKDFIVDNGDLLIGMDGDFNRERWAGGKALLNQRVCKITTNGKSLDQQYLYHFLPMELDKIHRSTPSVTVKHLSVKGIRSIDIPLPPLEEQKRIAAILDKADAIHRKRQQAIDLADQFLRSVFLDMFGDPFNNPSGWPVKLLGEVTRLVTDGKHGDCIDEPDSGYFFVSAKSIRNGVIDYSDSRQILRSEFDEVHKRTNLEPGDLVMINTGATIGRMAIAEEDERTRKTTFQKSVAIIKPDFNFVQTVFLKYVFLLRISDFASKGSGSAIKNLLLSEMRNFEIIIPPKKDQLKFTSIVTSVEQSIRLKEHFLESAESLFHAAVQLAFKGELTKNKAA